MTRIFDEEEEKSPMREAREVADLHLFDVGETRCKLHGTPDCSPCRSVEESIRRANQGALPARKPSPTSVCDLVIPKPSEEESRRQREKLEPIIKINLGIRPDEKKKQEIIPRRKFFQPLPPGIPEWPKELDGMTTENIAMFLTLPEVLYTNYEKNKANPPKTIFLSPAEAFDHPSWIGLKLSIMEPQFRTTERSVTHIGTEIVAVEGPKVIQTDAVPDKQRRGKLSVPPGLLADLATAKEELKLFSAKRSRQHGGLTGKELATAKRRKYREIEKLEDQIASYDRQWGKINIPGTGRPSFDIEIIPCPTGSSDFFPMTAVERYVRAAFGTRPKDDPQLWDWRYAAFENIVIDRAIAMKVFRECPDDKAKAQWRAGWRPGPGEDFGYPVRTKSADHGDIDGPLDRSISAKDVAAGGYGRREDGSNPDNSIRRVGPGSSDRRYGAGAKPDDDNEPD